MSGSTIGFDAVGVRYADADADALRGVSFDVAAGEIVAIVGPSGCGKTTLLRTVNRLVEPTDGAVLIDGVDVQTMDAVTLRRRVGYAIQAVGLFAHMTVGENVGIVPSLLGWPRDRIQRRVDDLLERVHLDPARFRDRRPRKLSGGEAQRVGVARALGGEPGVLLMDEPFGAVDAIVRTALQDEITRVVRDLGTTTLFVTHDVHEALRIADRICVMNGGRVEQIDAPGAILGSPATDFVRRLFEAARA
ncbi:MAG: ATP-binding cassette domain-containing protein [Vulcanimicrobiaceae bacterium]